MNNQTCRHLIAAVVLTLVTALSAYGDEVEIVCSPEAGLEKVSTSEFLEAFSLLSACEESMDSSVLIALSALYSDTSVSGLTYPKRLQKSLTLTARAALLGSEEAIKSLSQTISKGQPELSMPANPTAGACIIDSLAYPIESRRDVIRSCL